jgi:hypothetical protein
MSDQLRVFDQGDPVNTTDENRTREYLQDPGVYTGFGLGVDTSGDLTIASGAGLQPNGVMWYESDTTTISFTPPGAATDYTVVASHTNTTITGGAEVTYSLQSGAMGSVSGGVILGWIYHPGGGVSLVSDYLVNAPNALPSAVAQNKVDTKPVELWVPFQRTYSDVAGMGGNVTFTGHTHDTVLFDTTYFVTYQKVKKAGGPAGDEILVQHVNFNMGDWRPAGFDFLVNIPGGARLVLELRDTDLNIVTITGSPITTTTNWEWASIEVDRTDGNFDTNKPYELRLTHTVGSNQEIKLAAVKARYWPYPS